MKCKKPKSVQIFGVKIKIKYVQSIEGDPDETVSGEYDPSTHTITVVDNKDWKRVLVHEMTHACLDISGISQSLENTQEESITTSIENGLHKYFKF